MFNFCAGPRGCNTALRATWQRHTGPRGSATRAHAAYAFIYLCYIVYIYNGYSQPSVDRKGIRPIRLSGLINPTILFFYFRVGLIHTAFIVAGDVAKAEASDSTHVTHHASIQWTRGPPHLWSWHMLIKRIITVRLKATWQHHTCRSVGRAVHRSKIKHVRLNTKLWRPWFNLGGSIWRIGSRSNGGDLKRFITPLLKASSRPPDRDLTVTNRRVFKTHILRNILALHPQSNSRDITITVWWDASNPDRWCGLNASIGRLHPIWPIYWGILRFCKTFLRDFV